MYRVFDSNLQAKLTLIKGIPRATNCCVRHQNGNTIIHKKKNSDLDGLISTMVYGSSIRP